MSKYRGGSKPRFTYVATDVIDKKVYKGSFKEIAAKLNISPKTVFTAVYTEGLVLKRYRITQEDIHTGFKAYDIETGELVAQGTSNDLVKYFGCDRSTIYSLVSGKQKTLYKKYRVISCKESSDGK